MKRSKLQGGAFVERRSGDAFVEEENCKKENWKDDEDRSGLFIYGLSHFTGKKKLVEYFRKYDKHIQCRLLQDKHGRSRGIASVVFAEQSAFDDVLQNNPHRIDGKWVSFLISEC